MQHHFSASKQIFEFAVSQGTITLRRRADLFGDIELRMERGV